MAYDVTFTTLTIEDTYGRTKSKRVEMVTSDAAQAEIDMGVIISTYANVMNGFVRKAVMNGALEFAGAVPAGVNIDTGMTISCQLAGRSARAALKVPTPDPAVINADGTVNLADVNVAALEALYQAAGIARLSDGEAITGFVSGTLDK
jgi:hypothetical protein